MVSHLIEESKGVVARSQSVLRKSRSTGLTIEFEVLTRLLQEAVLSKHICIHCWLVLNEGECAGPLDGTKRATAVKILFKIDKRIIEDGAGDINSPTIKVGGTSSHSFEPRFVRIAGLGRIPKLLYPGVTTLDRFVSKRTGTLFNCFGAIVKCE